MDERKILRELARMLRVNEADLPKTLRRFKEQLS